MILVGVGAGEIERRMYPIRVSVLFLQRFLTASYCACRNGPQGMGHWTHELAGNELSSALGRTRSWMPEPTDLLSHSGELVAVDVTAMGCCVQNDWPLIIRLDELVLLDE